MKLTEHQRRGLIEFTILSTRLRKKFETSVPGKQVISVTRKELDELNDQIGGSARYAPAAHRKRLMAVQARVVRLFEVDHHELLTKKLARPTP